MNKKEIIKTLDIASFVSAVIATLLVLIFQFTGEYMVMKASIVMYAACFLLLVTLLSFKVHSVFSKKEKVDGEDDSNEQTSKKKATAIVLLVLASIAFIFTCVFLVLY